MSDKYRPIVNQAQALEAPRSSSQYLWVVSVRPHRRSQLVSVQSHCGRRVARSAVHGMAAINVLSTTSPLTLVTRHKMASFELQPLVLLFHERRGVSNPGLETPRAVGMHDPLTRTAQRSTGAFESLFSVQWPSPPFKDACLTSKRKLIVVTRQHVGEVLHDALRHLPNRSIAPIVVLLEVTMFNQPLPEIVFGLAFMAALDSCFRGLVAADKKTCTMSLAGIVVVSGLASVAVSAYNGDAMKKAIESYRSA
ncbi:hypothetical protein H257_06536 [Aphanomyces astaci]|uniref:Uncharacterized protein n=1 Tax=Aphanomyces astaci TaxID=112090 RepID=W4GLE8_APHAT|nr:hypothetical protein H257_06536 [Aphanomyces astaci]ETV80171.1 hypothetical protein H257_06536 [Aphanomyces astaci]|eukprot:XP_009830095.1 hypothetical protein H257_06536 [Aphanomyces astaci]